MAGTSLEDYYKSLSSVYDPQAQLVQQQMGQLPGQAQAQMSALEQAKVNAFKDITARANRRGMLFSGVPVSEQATYVGEKYLPAAAGVQQSQQNAQNQLMAALNEINASRRTRAQDLYSGEQNAIQQAEAQRYAAELAAQQKEMDRQAQMQQAQMAAEAKIQAAQINNSRAPTPRQPSAIEQKQMVIGAMTANITPVLGKDKFISPDNYLVAKNDWLDAGYSGKEFDSIFARYRNPKNPYYQVG